MDNTQEAGRRATDYLPSIAGPPSTDCPAPASAGYCRRCGTLVWSSLSPNTGRPTYTEMVTCPACGADNSIRPSLEERVARARGLLRKRRKVVADIASRQPLRGLPFLRLWLRTLSIDLWWLRHGQTAIDCFRMPYEMRRRT